MKTLKDLNPNTSACECEDCENTVVWKKEIREEAIKWIKALNEKTQPQYIFDDFSDRDTDGFSTGSPTYEAAKNWIKKFFNITEEDLK